MKQIYDLSFGNPEFLQPYWELQKNVMPSIEPANGIKYEKDGGQKNLIEAIKDLHKKIGNAVVDDKFIVVGNGATHLLYASVSMHRGEKVAFRNPYYFKFPGIITQAGAHVAGPLEDATVEIVVQPHNPLNLNLPPLNPNIKHIYDLCYNWPEYCDVELRDEDIMIFNLSKSTGHAASRIGWVICKNESDALKIREALELSTGGVSHEAQIRATAIIKNQTELYDKDINLDKSVFGFGKKELEFRWNMLKKLNVPGLKIINNSGMFALCEYDCPVTGQFGSDVFLNNYGIKTISAAQCGGASNQLRINVGCKQEDFINMLFAFDAIPSYSINLLPRS